MSRTWQGKLVACLEETYGGEIGDVVGGIVGVEGVIAAVVPVCELEVALEVGGGVGDCRAGRCC